MNDDLLIPLIITAVAAMSIGAIYLLSLLLGDGNAGHDDDTDDEAVADDKDAGNHTADDQAAVKPDQKTEHKAKH